MDLQKWNTEYCMTQSVPLADMVKSLLIREGDTLGINFRKYYDVAKDVYRELNLYAIRWSKRFLIEVNKKNHSITLPDDCLLWSSMHVINDCGNLVPLMLNNNLKGEIADINLAKDCGCECNCQSELCGQLKHYEVIYKDVTAPMPDGSVKTFQTYSRKAFYPNGEMYQEWTDPVVQKDAAGTHLNTVLQTFTKHLCELEVTDCGCVKDCPTNRDRINKCCGPDFLTTECCKPFCPPVAPNLWYGYEQLGCKVVFDSNFCYDHVLVRYYPEPSKGNLEVPLLAKKAILAGIKVESLPYDFDKFGGYRALAKQRQHILFEQRWNKEKGRLFRLLNRISLQQFYYTILTPGRNFTS